jgi:hypothetical protein
MGNKIATEEDYWMCTGGIMPAQMQTVQLKVLQKDGKKYLMKSDTSTASFGDFTCKWVMLIAALIAAVVIVAVVATGGAALAVIVAAGAIAGAGGAIYGSVLGSLICGQKAAIARTWLGEKSNLIVAGQHALTTGSTMQCPVFGSKIVHAPNVKNWWDALRVGIGNFGETVILGALGGALIGVGGALFSGAAAIAWPTLASVGTNIVGSVTGWGMAARLYFGANALSNKQALGEVDMNNVEERDAAFGDAAFPEYGSIKRIFSGQAEPMDAMLLFYFLNLRVPGNRGGTSPKEEAGKPKEETKPKEEEVKPVENTKPVEEKPASGKDGKAYEANIKKPSFKNGQSDGGPGTWETRPTPEKGAVYQEKVTGAPKDTEYVVKTDKMKSGEKKFDGYDPDRNVLTDAKDWDKWPPSGNKDWEIAARKSEMNNAKKDAAIAKDAGSTLEYHVPTQEKADQLNELFNANRIDIKVVVTPK